MGKTVMGRNGSWSMRKKGIGRRESKLKAWDLKTMVKAVGDVEEAGLSDEEEEVRGQEASDQEIEEELQEEGKETGLGGRILFTSCQHWKDGAVESRMDGDGVEEEVGGSLGLNLGDVLALDSARGGVHDGTCGV